MMEADGDGLHLHRLKTPGRLAQELLVQGLNFLSPMVHPSLDLEHPVRRNKGERVRNRISGIRGNVQPRRFQEMGVALGNQKANFVFLTLKKRVCGQGGAVDEEGYVGWVSEVRRVEDFPEGRCEGE